MSVFPVVCILLGLTDVAKNGGAQRCVRQHRYYAHQKFHVDQKFENLEYLIQIPRGIRQSKICVLYFPLSFHVHKSQLIFL